MPTGRLVYLIGPSGAGKDSILDGARALLPPDAPVAVAHRYITRPADAGGENHVALSADDFALRLRHGLFALNWDSHDLRYGIGIEIDAWKARGLTVVVNGSRGALPQAAARYADLEPVAVTVAPEVLRQRLKARGRETPEAVERRLERAGAFRVSHPNLVDIRNDGPLADAVAAFARVLLPD